MLRIKVAAIYNNNHPRIYSCFLSVFIFIITLSGNIVAQSAFPDTSHNDITYTLPEAVANGFVEATIRGAFDQSKWAEIINMDGIHYGKCMMLAIQNKSDSTLKIHIDAGQLLIPDDSSVQIMVITHDVMLALRPGEFIPTHLYAMCAEIHNASPSFAQFFTPGPMADSNLVRLASYLGKNYLQNLPAQHAVWALANQASKEQLIAYGADSLSLLASSSILDSLNLVTNINPLKATLFPVETGDDATMVINKNYIYAGGVVILVLVVLVVVGWRGRMS